jgi:hypothetical protein
LFPLHERRAGNCHFGYPQAHHREHRAFGRLDNLPLRVSGMAFPFALTWLDIEVLREPWKTTALPAPQRAFR